MGDIKINKKYICESDGFRITTDDQDHPEEYYKISHDGTDGIETVGKGSFITHCVEPIILADDGYIDLPATSLGVGYILIGDGVGYVHFYWDVDNTVTLVSSSVNVDDANTDDYFCIYDNTTSVRIKNRLGTSLRIVFDYRYSEAP